jgi:diguanylate cyclase (GGDEF)-like protein/PAS domain S-box-containing protein
MVESKNKIINLKSKTSLNNDLDYNKLDTAFGHLEDAISIQDSNFRVLYENNAMEKLIGSDNIGELCYKVYGRGRDTICVLCPVLKVFQDGKVHVVEKSLLLGQEKVYLEIKASPIKNYRGEVIAVIEMIRNISDRKRAEADLIENRSLLEEQLDFSKAINQMTEVIISTDKKPKILENMVRILGEVIKVNQVSIVGVSTKKGKLTRIAAWNMEQGASLGKASNDFDLLEYKDLIVDFLDKGIYIESHDDNYSDFFKNNHIGDLIHQVQGVKSFLAFPFDKRSDGFHLILLRQIDDNRTWREAEILFLDKVANQVAIALQKIQLLKQQKKAEQAIWEEKERALVTLYSIADGVITTNSNGLVESLNPVAEELTGWTSSEAKGKPLEEVYQIRYHDPQILENSMEACLNQGKITEIKNEMELIHRHGGKFAIEHSSAPIKGKTGQILGAVLVFRDVSDKRALLQQMTHQALHDSLTGLPNRILLNQRLEQALIEAKPNQDSIAVMFLDLDRFKYVNDTMGHHTGDIILKGIAKRLNNCIKDIGTVSSLGGDEFTLVIPKLNQVEDAAKIAKGVLNSLSEPWFIDGKEFIFTTSIGIAIYPNDSEDVESLLNHADTAMYRAKEKGNKYEFYNSSMNDQVMEKMTMENDLKIAVNYQQFHLEFQPRVDTQTMEILGMEALIRWDHPQYGLIMPSQFIPLAEETGLILPIGEWVLKSACYQNKLLQQQGFPPMKISVNISASQLQQKNFLKMVDNILKETGMSPQWLELEITESIVMQDVEFTIGVLKELQGMGINIAIDDFGTGYSSLSYLKNLPINTLKIDKSFIDDLTRDDGDVAIVAAVTVLAKNLKLRVVAEGVETKEQALILKELGCHEIQGYLYSQPLPFEKLVQLLNK